ncbi:MAG: hypothetical protein ACTSXO_01785 [Candidatus Heimdallarchaeota archaeon]|nr:MAG: hypothetical protein DRO91_08535 [Candidatus Heimdallarchaeota archaeon]
MTEKKVKPGMSPEEIATLHYELLIENNREEWLKTFRKRHREQADKYGSSPDLYWRTGRKYVDELGYSYKFKNKVENQSSDKRIKFFFYRLNKEGKPQGSGQVPIHVVKDEEDNDEWRVDVASW